MKAVGLRINKTSFLSLLPFVLLLLLVAVFSILSSSFLTVSNLFVLMSQCAILLLISSAASLVIVTGAIDLSLIANVTLSGIVCATCIPAIGLFAVIPALATGTLIGFINGYFYIKLRLPSFILTFGMMSVIEGTALLISNGNPIWFSNDKFCKIFAQTSLWGNLQIIVIWSVLIYLFVSILGMKTRFGRHIVAIGGDEKIAQIVGIPVGKCKVIAFTLAGLLCGCAGILKTARIASASPIIDSNQLMNAIAAVVIGGTSIAGGVGGVHKVFIGVLVMTVLSNGLDVAFVPSHLQLIIKGLTVVLVVIFTLDREKISTVK